MGLLAGSVLVANDAENAPLLPILAFCVTASNFTVTLSPEGICDRAAIVPPISTALVP